MSTSKLLARASAVALFASFLTACGGGGGGGGGGDGGPTSPGTSNNLAAMDRGNARQFAGAYSRMLNMGSEALNTAPQLIAQLASLSNGGGSIDETFDCTSGSVRISGSVNAGNIGTITLDYRNCSETDPYYNYSYVYDGAIRITTRAFSGGWPTAFDYHYDNYRFELPQLGISNHYSGDFSVDPDAEGMRFAASVKTTDGRTQRTVESTNYVAIYNNGSLPIRSSGRISESRLGAITVSGDAQHIYLSGHQGRLRIDNGGYMFNPLHVAFDANSDGTYESFAWLPWDLLESEPSVTNSAPTVNVSNPGLTFQASQNAMVPINGVADAEFDLLSYSVKALQTPGNVGIQLALQEDGSFTFRTAGHGDYIIALTVDDGRGGVTTQNLVFHVTQAAPLVQTPVGSQIVNGELVNASVQPSNPEAGPFTYQIVSGPAGMTVDSQGTLHWQASNTFFERVGMQVTVKVSNADNDVTVPLQFSVEDNTRTAPLVRSGNWGPVREKNTFVLDFNNDGTSRILLTENNHVVRTLKFQGGTYVDDWMYPYSLAEGTPIDNILPIDLDNDGDYEVVVQAAGKIVVIDETHKRIARSVDLNATVGYGIAAADIDNDGKVELVALHTYGMFNSAQAIVLDALTLAEKWRTPQLPLGADLAIGNVDNDAALEIVFAGGYVYDGATQTSEWVHNDAFGSNVVTGDLDGDGIEEILGARVNLWGSYPTAFSAASKLVLWSINADTSTCSIALAQLDIDSAKEIVTTSCLGATTRAFDANGSGATQKWSLAQPAGMTNFVVADADNDGDADFVQIARDTSSLAHAYPYIVDASSQTVVFNGVGSAEGTFAGAVPSMQNGVRQILFSTRSLVPEGVFFASLDATGQSARSAVIAAAGSQPVPFCAADYDGDTRDDVLFSAIEFGAWPFLESYDLLSESQQWKQSLGGSTTSPQPIACGDFNNDGHIDVATYSLGNHTIAIEDAFNQSQIWSSNDGGEQLAAGDSDGDGKLELYAATNTLLKKYAHNGSSYSIAGTLFLPTDWWFSGPLPLVSLTDVDGDGKPEIIVAQQDSGWITGHTTTKLIVLNSDLSERSRSIFDGFVTAIAPERIGNGQILATIAEDSSLYSATPVKHRAALIDLASGQWIWRSPQLLGAVTPNSLHYDASAPNGGSISIGTASAMYITR